MGKDEQLNEADVMTNLNLIIQLMNWNIKDRMGRKGVYSLNCGGRGPEFTQTSLDGRGLRKEKRHCFKGNH